MINKEYEAKILTDQKWDEDIIPTLSVFNWVYNHKDYIRESIESILMQKTNFKVEIIIHDDASNDGTAEIILEYQNKYPHLFNNIMHTENQWSQGKSVMTPLFEKPIGKYIALTHGDDYWTDPLKLQKQVDFLEANEKYSLVYHPCMELKGNELEKEKLNSSQIDRDLEIDELLLSNKIHTPSVLFRRFKLPLPLWFKDCPVGDYPLWVLLGLKGKIRYIAEYMAVYRIHNTSSWSSQSIKYTGTKWLKVLDLISSELNEMQYNILSKQYKTLYNRLILEYKFDFNAILDLNSSLNNQSKLIKFNCKNIFDIISRWPVSFWELFLRKLKKT